MRKRSVACTNLGHALYGAASCQNWKGGQAANGGCHMKVAKRAWQHRCKMRSERDAPWGVAMQNENIAGVFRGGWGACLSTSLGTRSFAASPGYSQ
jgi:hypothetical protein